MIYLISPNQKYSGNLVTINRISNYFQNSQIITIQDLDNIKINNQDIVIGLHAYKVGKYLINKNYNFYIIIGGTDLNCDLYDNQKKNTIIQVLNQSKKIIVFNVFQKMLISELKLGIDKTVMIPQAVGDLKSNNFDLRKYLGLNSYDKIYLIVGNLRRVKDPLFLINEFKFLYDNFNYNFVYIGNNVDNYFLDYYWIKHINGLDQVSAHTAIKQANGLINTSLSEGMSQTILEAMKLRCPVYVRVNNSNEYIVQHNITGYLFVNPNDFLKAIKFENTDQIRDNAYQYVNSKHNIVLEKEKFENIIT